MIGSALSARLAAIRARHPVAEPEAVAEVVRAVLATMSGDLTATETSLLGEVEALGRTIATAKAEIAALHVDDITASHIPFATDELDAIVAHTASATHAILESCETLDAVMEQLDGEPAARLLDATTRIYEACSFQDITGQRITKVVGTLKAIEAKVAQITSAFRRPASVAAGPANRRTRGVAGGVAAERAAASGAGDGPVRHRQAARQFRLMRYLPASVLAVVLSAVAVRAEESAAAQVRVGNHDGFGRVVIELARPAPSRVVRDGQRVTLQFDADAVIDPPSELPRNVRSMTGGIGRAEITLAAGATLRDWRTGGRLVIDVFDPVRDPAAAPSGAAPSGATLSGATPSGVSPSAATPLEATPSAERRRPRVRSAPGSAPTPLSQGTASVPSASPDLPRPSPLWPDHRVGASHQRLCHPPTTTAARVPPATLPRVQHRHAHWLLASVRGQVGAGHIRAVPTSGGCIARGPRGRRLSTPVPPTACGNPIAPSGCAAAEPD